MESDTLLVPREKFSIEEPWTIPTACRPIELRRASDARPTRLRTTAAAYADERCLNVVFLGEDDEVVATHLRRDAPLYEEDVMEIFLSPVEVTSYCEIEINPLGTIFDARIHSPDGVRATMSADIGWNCENLITAVRRTPASWDTIVRIPFASLGSAPPARGEVWRGNLFRIDRNRRLGDEFSAWRPTLKNPPDFHVPAAFGSLQFA